MVAAGRLIARKEPFTLTLSGAAADTLKKVAAPGTPFDRALLSSLAANLSLATLPGVMLYALGSGYRLAYENLGGEGIRMHFQRDLSPPAEDRGAPASNKAPQGDSEGS